MAAAEGPAPPSPFFDAWRGTLHEAAALGPLADLACGRGRHALACAQAGLPVVGLDRHPGFLAELGQRARAAGQPLPRVRCDLESDAGIPLRSGSCGGILVFRFLFRPLCPEIVRVLAPGGLLLYETFREDQRGLGHGPSNPAFLLRDGELPELFPGLDCLAFEQPVTAGPRPEALARLAARRPR